jgi:gentisate 1,2-dioxygenase
LASGLAWLAAGCASAEVRHTFGPGWEVAGLGPTFDWVPPPANPEDNARARRPDVDKMIQELVEKALMDRGYRKQIDSPPDFRVDYRIAKEVLGDPNRITGNDQYTEGGLALYVFNPKTGQAAWRATASQRLDPGAAPDKVKKDIGDILRRMVETLPPARG